MAEPTERCIVTHCSMPVAGRAPVIGLAGAEALVCNVHKDCTFNLNVIPMWITPPTVVEPKEESDG